MSLDLCLKQLHVVHINVFHRIHVYSSSILRHFPVLQFSVILHDADTDMDILARILADTSDTRDFLKLFLWQTERHADILATIFARMSARMSVSVSWNASFNSRQRQSPVADDHTQRPALCRSKAQWAIERDSIARSIGVT